VNGARQTGTTAASGAAQDAARILVAGVGNIFLRDDGFGPEVARRLAEQERSPDVAEGPAGQEPGPAASARVVDYGIRGMHLAYDLLAGVDALVLVDTVASDGRGTAPGSLRVLQVRAEDLEGTAPLDPHGMDPAAVLDRLRSLGGRLPVTYVVGCVPAETTEGIGLSPPVAAAVPQAMAAVVNLLTGDIPAALRRR
jgi:hydrogenase maturation protease